ncbi:MAG: hypothetical protein WBL23_11770 [Salinisphaera sp.]|uniref:hypothetical protein n=1 Tax=Salinisphaera sp. TaxID=1914330 RepID=UPI003C7A9C1E
MAEPGLRCLDLVDCPHLIELDLTGCRADLHLTVRDCPDLALLRLPRVLDTGAVVHVDRGTQLGPLQILGHLASLDACWDGGQFATESGAGRELFANAYLGPWLETGLCADHGVVVLWGELPGRLNLPDEAVTRYLHVSDAPGLVSLTVGCPLAALTVADTPALTTVSLPASVGRFRATHAPALSRIDGCGRRAILADGSGAAQGVTLTDHWHALRLSESPVEQLFAPHLDTLALVNCANLRHVTRDAATATSVVGATRAAGLGIERLQLDASAMRHLVWAARDGDTEAAALLGDWCGEATHRRGWLDALTVFADLARQGLDPAWLWGLRCRLHARANRWISDDEEAFDSIELAVTRWHWDLPQDLAQRGWDADLALWLACRDLPCAQRFQHLLARTGRPRHLATMARACVDEATDAASAALIDRCLKKALRNTRPVSKRPRRHGIKPSGPPPAQDELFFVDTYFEPIWHCIVAHRDRALAEALGHYISIRLTPTQQIRPLARLLRLGLIEVRPTLMHLATELRGAGNASAAAEALANALSPVNQPVLAAS